MDRNIVPAIILANTALSETIEFLRKADSLHRRDVDRSLREELDYADTLKLTERATDCLRTACSARNLTMVVIDPRTHHRHEVPAEYFDQRAIVDLEFGSSVFRACECSELVVADPLFQLVAPFRGWVHGFVEADFRPWLEDPDIGPLTGPRIRPFFHAEKPNRERTEMLEPVSIVTQRTDAQDATAPMRVRLTTKREAVASWVKDRFPGDLPVGVSIKDIARDFAREKQIHVDLRTVRRALGRK